MTSTPRGFVLIINNENFSNGKQRTGAQQDGEMLIRLFTGILYVSTFTYKKGFHDTYRASMS
jgi:hypothetical protein